MKIVLCKGQLLGPISGADETLVTYALQLQRLGHAVSVLLLYPCSPHDQHYLRLREAGVHVAAVATNSLRAFVGAGRKVGRGLLRSFPALQRPLRKKAQRVTTSLASLYQQQCYDCLKQARADLVHVVTPDSGAMVIIGAAHAAGIPVIYQELGIPYHPPGFEAYYEQFTSVLPLCAEVTTLSPALARQFQERLPGVRNVSVLPIITDDLRNGHRAERAATSEVVVGFAARIENLKGPLILLEAFAAASRARAGLRLVIAGGGSLERKLKARARALGVAPRCVFVGVYTKPAERRAFMEGLDIFALPSLTEGTPNCIAEAMSHGLPVIASAVGGIPDVVTPESGILVTPGNVETLAEAVLSIAGDATLRRRMGRAARRRYEKLFSPEAVLPVLMNTYKRVAAGGPCAAPSPSAVPDGHHPWAEEASYTGR